MKKSGNYESNMEQVAKNAGVSKALVSRFINEKTGVSEKSRVRIKSAIEHLHYRLPGTGEGNIISIVLDGVSIFHRQLLSACSEGALKEDYALTILDCMDNDSIKFKMAEILPQSPVKGVIVYGSSMSDKIIIDALMRHEIPFVLIENDLPDANVEKILIDNFQGQFNITKEVISRGFTDIRMIPWNLSTRAGTERLSGFFAAIRESNLMLANRYVCQPEKPGFQGVFEIIERLHRVHNLPQVFICSGDSLAAYALASCTKLGIKVPDELSITGFDGIPGDIFAPWSPVLTTMRQPLYEMSQFAIGRLLSRIKNPGEPPLRTLFHTEFIAGETLRHNM